MLLLCPVPLEMTPNEPSNKLPPVRGFSFFLLETSCRLWKGRLVRAHQLFCPMNARAIPSARWGYNPHAVGEEFSLARGRRLPLRPPMLGHQHDDGEQLLRRRFGFLWSSYFPWRGNREWQAERFRPVEAAPFALLLLAKCHSFLIRLMGANRGGGWVSLQMRVHNRLRCYRA